MKTTFHKVAILGLTCATLCLGACQQEKQTLNEPVLISAVDKAQRKNRTTLVSYKVRPGDNLNDIAKRSGTTIEQIRKDSNIKGNTVHPGEIIQVLYVPKEKRKAVRTDIPTFVNYKVRPGDNIQDIAKRSGTTIEQIRKDSGIQGNTINPGQVIKVRYIPESMRPGQGSAKP
ncbi:MAG: LysM peptidoglycan-binding domain-containing protein [Akkermansia sp.]|nr:LysM peptidoglycan-binding domain-containing protein [Akkermansia sp.]